MTAHRCNGTLPTWTESFGTPGTTVNTDYTQETMRDELGKNSKHPVLHRKRTVRLNTIPYGRYVAFDAGTGYSDTPVHPEYCIYSYRNDLESQTAFDVNSIVNSPPQWWTVGSPSFPDEVHLKEDVLEKAKGLKADILLDLIEAHQMASFIVPFSQTIPNYRADWKRLRRDRRLVKRIALSEVKGIARSVSGNHLMYAFGIAPLVSDLIVVNKALATMARDIRRFVSEEPMRYSSKAEHVAFFTMPKQYGTGVGNGANAILSVEGVGKVAKPPTTRYVLVVKPKRQLLDEALNSIDFLLSRFASSPASLAWELVPFSFVADWFVDLRGILRLLDSAMGFTPYDIVSFTRSYSYAVSASVTGSRINPCNGTPLYIYPAGQVEFKHYERSLVTDKSYWPVWKPRFGNNQMAISASLITQMLLKRI
jgi:hypothetical protein